MITALERDALAKRVLVAINLSDALREFDEDVQTQDTVQRLKRRVRAAIRDLIPGADSDPDALLLSACRAEPVRLHSVRVDP